MLYTCMNVCVLISSQAEVKGLNSILKSTLLLEEMFNSTSFVSLKLVVEGLRDFFFPFVSSLFLFRQAPHFVLFTKKIKTRPSTLIGLHHFVHLRLYLWYFGWWCNCDSNHDYFLWTLGPCLCSLQRVDQDLFVSGIITNLIVIFSFQHERVKWNDAVASSLAGYKKSNLS